VLGEEHLQSADGVFQAELDVVLVVITRVCRLATSEIGGMCARPSEVGRRTVGRFSAAWYPRSMNRAPRVYTDRAL
jgi:hypothetical protein